MRFATEAPVPEAMPQSFTKVDEGIAHCLDLCEPVSSARSHLHADAAENIGVVAVKDAEVLPVLVLQIELMAWLGRASVPCTLGQSIHFLSHWYSILQNESMTLWL